MNNKLYDCNLSTYNEASALQQLLKAIAADADAMLKEAESGVTTDWCRQFMITVGGVQTAFTLGGPQMEALYRFVQHVADENCYTVDIENAIVTD